MIFKLSYLNSNLALTLGYLNPALNNSALKIRIEGSSSRTQQHKKKWLFCAAPVISLHKKKPCSHKQSGVSIKAEVASRFEQSINKELLVPFFWGGGKGSGHVLARKILKFQSPKRKKMRLSAFWGINLRTTECVFHSKKMQLSIYQSHNQFLQARKQILR